MIRNPVVAGQFYPEAPQQLEEMIRGMVDETAAKADVVGLILPHAGYIYSGVVAGAAVSRIRFTDTFIIMGPNHTGRGKPFSIMTGGLWETPLGQVEIDSDLGKKILAASSCLEEDSDAHVHEHSIEVQLPFLQYFRKDIKILPIILSYSDGETYKKIGTELAEVLKDAGEDVVIIASSDMTHYEPQESAREKDNKAIEAILNLDEDTLLERVAELGISMCGYAPVVSLITAAKKMGATGAELVKYQTSGDTTGDYARVVGYAGIIINGNEASPLAKLARETVELYVREGKMLRPESITPEMQDKAGVFVSIYKYGELRGCIGTFESTQGNVAEEIVVNAISSAARDPRFSPVTADEISALSYSVDVLSHPEPVEGKEQLDPKRYGIIVEADVRRGLLLPDLEGVDTVEYQIDICRRKASIAANEPVQLYRFEVKRNK
ncbi:AmmeMemoRadiSam system protein B [Chloroflexota bacterium]